MTVATVLRSGGVFTPEWVYRLQRQCERHLPPHDFVCLTDLALKCEMLPLVTGWPGWWAKLELHRPDILTDRVIYFDLDTLIVGPADPLFDYAGSFAALTDFYTPEIAASGVMLWDGSDTWDTWNHIVTHRPAFRGRSDYFLNTFLEPDRLQDLYPHLIGSYKAHYLADGPDRFSVVCFHGKPRFTDLPTDNWARQYWEAA